MTTITAKQLADGQLPNAEGDLYTAPGGTITYIKSIVLYNTDNSTHTTTVKMLPNAGVARVVARLDLISSGTFYFDTLLVLDAADKIRGDDGGGGGNVIDYTICGAEEA